MSHFEHKDFDADREPEPDAAARKQRPMSAAERIAALTAENTRLKLQVSAAELNQAESELSRRDSLLLRAFMDRSDLLAWLKDERGRLVYANRNWFEQFALHEAEAIDKTDFDLFPVADARRSRALELEVIGGNEPLRSIETTTRMDGQVRTWQVTRFPFQNSRSERFVGGLAHDDTERARQFDEIRRASISDSLTGLLNSQGFDSLAASELMRARRRGSICTLVLINLEGLASTNERLGRAAGDALVALAAMVLRKVFRTTDIVARIAGDEFAILAPDTDSDVGSIKSRLSAAVAELSTSPILEAQMGFSVWLLRCEPQDADELEGLLARAARSGQ